MCSVGIYLYIVISQSHPGTPAHNGVPNKVLSSTQSVPALAPSYEVPAGDVQFSQQVIEFKLEDDAKIAKGKIESLYRYGGSDHARTEIICTGIPSQKPSEGASGGNPGK